jgi:hypothetical protein
MGAQNLRKMVRAIGGLFDLRSRLRNQRESQFHANATRVAPIFRPSTPEKMFVFQRDGILAVTTLLYLLDAVIHGLLILPLSTRHASHHVCRSVLESV